MPIKLTVTQPSPVELEYIEAQIKPETVGHITPTYEAQTVYPDSGTVFGSVEVDAIPDPTAIKEIYSNGDHDVRRYGTARVDVQPNLQDRTVTPTESAQTVTADSGYDGLQSVEVARIPTEYIIPTGTKNITANGTHDVTDYASASVSVQPNLQTGEATPTEQTQTITPDGQHDGFSSVTVNPIPPQYIVPQGKIPIAQNGTVDVSQFAEAEVNVSSAPEFGFVLEDWNEKGQPTTLRLCGFTDPPEWYFYPFADESVDNSRGYFSNRLTTVIINEGVVRIWYYVFRAMRTIQRVVFPSTIRTIQGWAFYDDKKLSELDFSLATEIPTLDSPNQLNHATGCVIKVPSSLLSTWQTATNWNALTDVVWEGV